MSDTLTDAQIEEGLTPLAQQVREVLTDEVLQQICSHVFWKRNTSARDVIFAAINPVLTRHAQQVQALTDERDRAREIAKRWHSHAADGRSGHGNYWPEEQKEIATWPK